MITSKQRAYLRSLANDIDTIMQVGKGGVSPAMVNTVSDALEARELIKIKMLENCELSVREVADTIAGRTKSEVVQVIGTRFVLYRESVKHKVIKL